MNWTEAERDEHMKMWNKLNGQEKIDWIFAQLVRDINGNWIEKRDLLEEE